MLTRNLRIAILVSLGLHVFAMSAVTITTPDAPGRMKPFKPVNFLGPILKKTAFDIMLEGVEPVIMASYRNEFSDLNNTYLDVSVSKQEIVVHEFSGYFESSMDDFVKGFLMGSKTIPELDLDISERSVFGKEWGSSGSPAPRERRVLYRPEPVRIMRGLYGNKETFKVQVNVLIDDDGNVKKAEPITTTGYPNLDITAVKFVKSWIFEPTTESINPDQWQVVEVFLKAGE